MAIVLALPLMAGDRSNNPLSATHTDQFNVSPGGAIRLENSFGDVDIVGWDRPEVEVTMIRSTEHLYSAKERPEAQRRLDSVQITAKQDGNDVVISTEYPARSAFLHPLSRRSDIEIHYQIHAPRDSKLTIDHNSGGVNVFDMAGDIQAAVINGQITLTLPSDKHYAIDAQSKLGDVYSDFDGSDQRKHLLGEDFASKGEAPAVKLYLRVRIGDIMILKMTGPTTD